MGAVQAAMPQTLLNETQQFFLNKYSSDCWKPLANFKSSEIADFGHLCQCFTAFKEGWTYHQQIVKAWYEKNNSYCYNAYLIILCVCLKHTSYF